MSVTAGALLHPAGGSRAAAQREEAASGRPRVRIATFAALGLYGTLRWAELLTPAPGLRLLGLLAVAVLLAAVGPWIGERSRAALIAFAVLATIAMFPLAGIPLEWVRHVRIAVSANAIGEGLSGLPRVLVPYNGINEWLRLVIVLGGGVLLLDAALMLAFAPRALSDSRRVAAALPLVALAVVPSTLLRPQLPYAQGLLLFALMAAFMWGERIRSDDLSTVTALAALAGAAAMIASPALDQRSPWLNYQSLTGRIVSVHVERFDWTQSYGPLHWPQQGHVVLEVQAQNPEYWKAENLDVFDGFGWTQQTIASTDPSVAPSALRKWTQPVHVTIRALSTTDVIGAGASSSPQSLPGAPEPGQSPGTYVSSDTLGPGDSYTVSTYSPNPSVAQLRAAGSQYPQGLVPAYMTLFVPFTGNAATKAVPVLFPTFHQTTAETYGAATAGPAPVLNASPYAKAYALARRLAASSATPYDFAVAITHYLAHGYSYFQAPTVRRYPLVSFLFRDKTGYCQQFAGAMALLLRMGGVPARVAVGFTTGTRDAATSSWLVSDIDAHAWVEAWFPGYGWVRFDPTPATAPARGGSVSAQSVTGTATPATKHAVNTHGLGGKTAAQRAALAHHRGGFPVALTVVLSMLAVLAALALRMTLRLYRPDGDEMVAELERALARAGRPLSTQTTLATIEQRFIGTPAAAYVRALRLQRFGGARALPSVRGRRAVRAQLRAGLGLGGRLRALWALPPRLTLTRRLH